MLGIVLQMNFISLQQSGRFSDLVRSPELTDCLSISSVPKYSLLKGLVIVQADGAMGPLSVPSPFLSARL